MSESSITPVSLTSDGHVASLSCHRADVSHKGGVGGSIEPLILVSSTGRALQRLTVAGRSSTKMQGRVSSYSTYTPVQTPIADVFESKLHPILCIDVYTTIVESPLR